MSQTIDAVAEQLAKESAKQPHTRICVAAVLHEDGTSNLMVSANASATKYELAGFLTKMRDTILHGEPQVNQDLPKEDNVPEEKAGA